VQPGAELPFPRVKGTATLPNGNEYLLLDITGFLSVTGYKISCPVDQPSIFVEQELISRSISRP
jgi:hypothetical protein